MYRELSTDVFNHVLSLPVDFLLHQKPGEVLQGLNQGTANTALVEQVLLEICPLVVRFALVSHWQSFDFLHVDLFG
jgi:ABC-type transport system involved in Fe-S cluster assembly fused permease/ATPase subunit